MFLFMNSPGEFDIRNLVISTYFTYLELLGILTPVAPYYSEYKISFIKAEDEIYNTFNHSRTDFFKENLRFRQQGAQMAHA